MTAPTAHSLTITDLLLRDPKHPEVRKQLEIVYRALCQQERAIGAQRQVVGDLLGVRQPIDKTRQEIVDSEN